MSSSNQQGIINGNLFNFMKYNIQTALPSDHIYFRLLKYLDTGFKVFLNSRVYVDDSAKATVKLSATSTHYICHSIYIDRH